MAIKKYKGKLDSVCLICNRIYKIFPCQKSISKYCSSQCRVDSFKGGKPWNKGLKNWMSKEGRKRISQFMSNLTGEKAHSWKGNNIGYTQLHNWVRKSLGNPQKCEHCGKIEGKFHWANKSRKYLRDLNDWIRLCISCHSKYDDFTGKAWKTKRLKYG